MKIEEVNVHSDEFEFKGKKYDCELVTKRDKELILQEAETSHKDLFDKLYNRNSLKADKVRIFLDKENKPIFGMVIYLINYKNENCQRFACGGYYQFWETALFPNPYQESICSKGRVRFCRCGLLPD